MTIIAILSLVTATVLVLHWILVLAGRLEIADSIPGHRNWSLSFIGSDAWLAVLSVLTAVFILTGSKIAGPCGLMLGASLSFNALFILSYLAVARRKLPRGDTTILAVMGGYSVALGVALLVVFWGSIAG